MSAGKCSDLKWKFSRRRSGSTQNRSALEFISEQAVQLHNRIRFLNTASTDRPAGAAY